MQIGRVLHLMDDEYFSEKIEVGIASENYFNVITNLEGPDMRNIQYIQNQANCRVSLDQTEPDDTGLYLLVTAKTEVDLDKAKKLCENLIATVKAQKQRVFEQKAAKRAKKRKTGKMHVSLPDPLIAAMNVYYPGDEVEPPPPGSPGDAKEHKMKFRMVGKQNNWFSQES